MHTPLKRSKWKMNYNSHLNNYMQPLQFRCPLELPIPQYFRNYTAYRYLVGIFLQTHKWNQVSIVFITAYQMHLGLNMWLTLGPSVASYPYYNRSLLVTK